MPTFLFPDVLIGPIYSRRFGNSLGINLLPPLAKFCNFDCVYCECGWNNKELLKSQELPSAQWVCERLEDKLIELAKQKKQVDSITFAGNGEPTIHPQFDVVIDKVISLRKEYFPNAKVVVLTNAAVVHKEKVFQALLKIDSPVLKLDAGSEDMFQKIDKPAGNLTLEKLTQRLKKFQGNCIIQTLFLRGHYQGQIFDNTSDKEVSQWISRLQEIQPRLVMLYSIDRSAPIHTLEKIPKKELDAIAQKVRQAGLKAQTYN